MKKERVEKNMKKRVMSFVLALTMMIVLGASVLAAQGTVVLSAQNLVVDDNAVDCEKYNIDGSNYFKLRDVAYLVSGTGSEFSVGWDDETKTVSIVVGEPYTPNGSEINMSGGDKSASAVPSEQTIMINGEVRSDLSVYNIGGNNYFKLRDLGTALGFEVDYDAESNTAIIRCADACNHQFGQWTVEKKTSCAEEGVQCRTCSICGKVEKKAIAKTEHKWEQTKHTNPTCTEDGVTINVCKVCGETKTETTPAKGHSYNSNDICTVCGNEKPAELNLTPEEVALSNKVSYISSRSVSHNDTQKCFLIQFKLLDSNKIAMKCPTLVYVYIINEDGETVYDKVKAVTARDYRGELATVVISDSAINGGMNRNGTIYYKVYSDYFTFNTYDYNVYGDLPMKGVTVELPRLPQTISYYSYSGKLYSSVKVTGISYELHYDDSLLILFSGEKTYDYQGSGQSDSCKIGWKLYDSEGYVVDDGTFYSTAVRQGEKFRNGECFAWDCIVPGETYRLEILDVN